MTNLQCLLVLKNKKQMNDRNTLLAVLTQAIGLAQARQRQAIVNFGFDMYDGLRNTSMKDRRGLFSKIDRNNLGLLVNQQARFNLMGKFGLYHEKRASAMQRWDSICSCCLILQGSTLFL